jgi:Ca-activated chloride channel family protein
MRFPVTLRVTSTLFVVQSLGMVYAQEPTGAPSFRASAQMVLIPVTVTDRNGKTIEGLHAENFNILDDQRPQRIVSFSSEDAPSSIGLIFDTSGSMRRTLGASKAIAEAFFGTANPEDEFLLLPFSTEPAAPTKFTTDIGALSEEIESAKASGMTALIDTVYLGLSRMREAKRPRRALLILSDGIDNYSRYSQADLMRVALEADVQVYVIIIDDPAAAGSSNAVPFRPRMAAKPWDRGPENQGPEMLEKLSDKTGGLHFHVHKTSEANLAIAEAGRAIRNQYVVGYHPPDSGDSGKWHRVRVKANVPRVNVYARNGYYSR